ncbi:MAG: hypothetical protein QOE66_3373, partial [Chloroflexota bacterium]|nr:hypothetical protein [Chloroflexota bacterium]
MSTATKVIGTGPGAWFGHIGDSVVAMERGYRTALRERRRRTITLTVIILLGLAYP